MPNQQNAIGINLGAKGVQAALFNNMHTKPSLVADMNGYGTLSEANIKKTFQKLGESIGIENIEGAVAAIPAHFNYAQRKMVQAVAKETGIGIRRFIHKPAAAALALDFELFAIRYFTDKNRAICFFEKGLFEIALVESGHGLTEMKTVDWYDNFDVKNIDTGRFNALCEKYLLKQNVWRDRDIDSFILVASPGMLSVVEPLVNIFSKKKHFANFDIEHPAAIGASFQAAIPKYLIKDMLMMDITSMPFFIETPDGIITEVISRNTTIPAEKTQTVSIAQSGDIAIKVFQGDTKIAGQNCYIGSINVQNTHSGELSLEFTFDIDVNGILNVVARDTQTGKEWHLKES